MFKLPFEPPPLASKLSLQQPVLLMGSCFSESIGQKLQRYKWDISSNPFGTIYNPMSLFQLIRTATDEHIPENSICYHQEVYYSWDAHSRVSDLTLEGLQQKVRDARKQVLGHLQSKGWVVITPGTAWVYELRESQMLVANCHKLPQASFKKRLLDPAEIVEAFERVYEKMPQDLNWLFTVSPVRHVRDGLVENNRSKAVLLSAVHAIVDRCENCHYFPSFEIVMDELRDYRFFAEDLVHPSSQTIDYVWQRLQKSWMNSASQDFTKQWEYILKALAHRPLHPGTSAHQKFLHATILRLQRLGNKVDIADELVQLQSQLKA